MTYRAAISEAKRLARAGPRVAAVVFEPKTKEFFPLPGYICKADNSAKLFKKFRQVALVDPDGNVWKKR